MRLLVTGGRSYSDAATLDRVLDELHRRHRFTSLVEGGAHGADALARRWGNRNVPHVITVRASWAQDGRAAGPMRNLRMLRLRPDLVVAFPGGVGTAHMAKVARLAGVRVVEVITA